MARIDWKELGFHDTRGWLLVFFVQLSIGVIRGVLEMYGFFREFIEDKGWDIVVQANIGGQYDALLFVMVYGVAGAVLGLVLAALTLVLMALGSKAVPRAALSLLVTNFGLGVIAFLVTLFLPKVDGDVYSSLYMALLGGFLGIALWGPYFLVSERVKKAYGKPEISTGSTEQVP